MIALATILVVMTGGLTTVSPSLPIDNDTTLSTSSVVATGSLPQPAIIPSAAVPNDSLRITLLPPLALPADTPRARPRAVEVSDWYERRLRIHRYLSYTVLPVFAVQYAAGRQLFDKGSTAPEWAKTTHRIGATTLAGVFTVNTVTGVWNLWDSRSVADKRALRYAHAILMLAADAGFTYAGAKLSREAETSLEKRKQHRTIALASIGVSTVSGLMMYFGNR